MKYFCIIFFICFSLAIFTEASKNNNLLKYKQSIKYSFKKLIELNDIKGRMIIKNIGKQKN